MFFENVGTLLSTLVALIHLLGRSLRSVRNWNCVDFLFSRLWLSWKFLFKPYVLANMLFISLPVLFARKQFCSNIPMREPLREILPGGYEGLLASGPIIETCTACWYSNSSIDQLCPTEIAYWAKNYVTILIRAAHLMTFFDLSKLNLVSTNVLKAFDSQLQW